MLEEEKLHQAIEWSGGGQGKPPPPRGKSSESHCRPPSPPFTPLKEERLNSCIRRE